MEKPRTPIQWYAMAGGAALLAIGVLALILGSTSFGTASSIRAEEFLIWTLNGWSSLAYIVLGSFGLFAAARVDASRSFAIFAGVLLVLAAVWGFIDGNDVAGIFAVNTTTNIFNAALGGLGIFMALPPERTQRRAGVGDERRQHREHPGHA